MIGLRDIEQRQLANRIADYAIRELLDYLCRETSDPRRIGQRAILANYVVQRDDEEATNVNLANQLGISEPAISRALSAIREKLTSIRVNFSSEDSNSR